MYNIDMVEVNHGREFMNKVKLNLFYAVVPGKIFVRMFSSTEVHDFYGKNRRIKIFRKSHAFR